MERLLPGGFEGRRGEKRLPVVPDLVVGLVVGTRREGREHLMGRLSAVEGGDEGLDHRERSVHRPRIAPRFEHVGRRDEPMTALRGLVIVEGEMNAQAHLVEGRGEVEIGWSVVDGVAAEDQQQIHLAGRHVGNERRKRFELVRRAELGGRRVANSLANGA